MSTEPARSELVSAVIIAYNAEPFLGRAIESVLAQTYAELELIVVDDGSTDATADIARGFDDARVRVISQPNAGAATARNTGLAAARGRLVAFLDADDYWYPTKLEVQVPALHARPALAAIGCRMHYVSNTGRVLGVMGDPVGPLEQERVAQGRLGPFHVSSGTLFRREPLEAVGGFDPLLTGLDPGMVDDRGVISALASSAPVDCVPEVLGAYRIHAGSVTARRYMAQCQGVRFVIAKREAGPRGGELSWDEFLRHDRRDVWVKRTDLAGYAYREAGLAVAERRWLAAAAYLVATSVIAPARTVRRLWRQQPWTGWTARGRPGT